MIKLPLLLNFLVECTVGCIMLFAPQLFHTNITPELLALSRTFGVAALIIGLITAKLFFSDDSPQLRLGLLIVLAYHTGIAIVQVLHPMQGMNPLVAPIFHGTLAFWAAASWLLLRRWY